MPGNLSLATASRPLETHQGGPIVLDLKGHRQGHHINLQISEDGQDNHNAFSSSRVCFLLKPVYFWCGSGYREQTFPIRKICFECTKIKTELSPTKISLQFWVSQVPFIGLPSFTIQLGSSCLTPFVSWTSVLHKAGRTLLYNSKKIYFINIFSRNFSIFFILELAQCTNTVACRLTWYFKELRE